MRLYWQKKGLRLHTHGLWISLVLASAGILRIMLIALGWPLTNSDESTMGLMAFHIAFRGEHPIFFYGQSYMGSLEAYIGAVFFQLFGPSLFALRLGMIALCLLFFFALYLLTRLLYTKEYALLSITLLCFGSVAMLTLQLKAVGGAVETLLFGCLSLLLATYLSLPSAREDDGAKAKRMCRSLLYSLLGLVMGLGIWSHMLILPFVGVAFLLLLLFRRDEWKSATAFLLTGLFVGLLPLIIYNIENPQQNSISTLLLLHSTGGIVGGQTLQSYTFLDAFLGAVLISVPMATGAPNICIVSTTPGQWREQLSSCLITQGAWGVGFLLLFLLACLLTARNVIRAYRSAPRPRSIEAQRNLILHSSRAMVLASAGLTLLAFLFSSAPALVPETSARYLVGLLVAFPVILAPLWQPLQSRIATSRLRNMLKPGRVGFLLIELLLVCATWGVFQQVPEVQAVNQQRQQLVTHLEQMQATRIYSDYWTCNNVIFESNEHIICAVLNNGLQTGQNRYPAYVPIVQRDPQAEYVFPISSAQAAHFVQQAGKMHRPYSTLTIDGYLVFRWTG